jgi:uncharacterized repeat protein (TIGR02543 family)
VCAGLLAGCDLLTPESDLFTPESDTVTVTFNAEGGSPGTQTKTVETGVSIGEALPAEPSRTGYRFVGWWTAQNGGGIPFNVNTTVMADTTVYAKWIASSLPPNVSLTDSLAWISASAKDGEDYIITLSASEDMSPTRLSYDKKQVSISLVAGTTEQTLSLRFNGSLFTVEDGVTLTLGNNVVLQGLSSNTGPLAQVNSGGTLIMENGSKISGNTNTASAYGGGVYVRGGTFIMSGGEISGNTSNTYGSGGVFVSNGGTFTMSGGNISGNSASQSAYGGGVFVDYNSAFTMSGGEISGNTSNSSGGGVFVSDGGTFTMSGGEISGNTSNTYGGGVFVGANAAFTKSLAGTIYGLDESAALKNTAAHNGYAVYVSASKKRNGTAGEGVTMNSSLSNAAGGWDLPIVTFDADGGSPDLQTQSVDSGSSLGANMPTEPEKSGFTFHGWWTEQNGGGTEFTADTPVDQDTTVYAKWISSTPTQRISMEPEPGEVTTTTASLFVNQAASFSVDGIYRSYQWYWDGMPIEGAISNIYSWDAYEKPSGIYELSVRVVGEQGNFSAHCRVSINAIER